MEDSLSLKIPKGFYNYAISNNNFFIADTNDSQNWDIIVIPLPKGKWFIDAYDNTGRVKLKMDSNYKKRELRFEKLRKIRTKIELE